MFDPILGEGETKKKIFTGVHLNKKQINTSSSVGIGKYFTATTRCLKCNVPIGKKEAGIFEFTINLWAIDFKQLFATVV
jgi:uncharacterized protein with PIN domain